MSKVGRPRKHFTGAAFRHSIRKRVKHALLTGRLTKGPCNDCGSTATEAHHEDYSKPLDVVWLCRDCHHSKHGLGWKMKPRKERP